MSVHPEAIEVRIQPMGAYPQSSPSHQSSASQNSIEAWLKQTEAAEAQPIPESVRKRKRSASSIADLQTSSAAKRGRLEPKDQAVQVMSLSDNGPVVSAIM